ncbi:intron Large complex component GCFC2 isoform X2 [Salarias fasciatus]|uniref:intron Large complex component GCFC2 isoform X2 n=1 Tax=Salarias fasciatus TaxID=181472 RepID=UPI001176F7EC|nr:GC-rich sequence DNA-binding factor 2-like isoform X2 [Salarias fasciatus]
MFNKKPRRNFRQRKDSSGDDEDHQKNTGEGEDNGPVPVSAVNKPLKAVQGRGISCNSKREATRPKSDSSDEEDGDTLEVTKEIKKENEDVSKKASSILSFSDDREVGESTFKLKKSTDKAVLFQVRKKKDAPSAKMTHASGGGGIPASNSPKQDDGSMSSPHSVDHGDDSDSEGSKSEDNASDEDGFKSPSDSSASDSSGSAVNPAIPNAEQIEAARRHRSAARAQKEYIPLGRDGHSSAGSTPDRYSKDDEEERTDEEDDEADDHEKRIEFAPRLKSIRERIAEKLGGSDCSLSGTDGEEQELWEETQIGKGVKRRPGEQSPSGSESSSFSSSSNRRNAGRQKKRPTGVKFPKTLPPVTVSMVKKRITGKLDSLKEVHRARQAELRRMESDVENAKASLEILEESSSEKQLKFYRTMTLYIHNLVECLQEKVVEINSLEVELHTLLSDHMEALLTQRREQVKKQAEHLQQLSYNSSEQSGTSANGAETKGDTTVTTEVESGVPEDTQPSPEEEEQLQKTISEILLRSQAVFSDVQEDFCSVKKILSRFEEWRESHSESYHNAYISLCLPKLLNPIIRHQLLAWNPLKDSSGDFENQPWFTAVETFCHGHGHEELENTDRQTLSNITERTVLPKITAYAELVWDPLSHQQSVCLSDVCHRLKEDFSIFEGEQSKPVKGFIEAVVRRLRDCVDEDIFIPLYPKKFLEDGMSPQSRFRDQQFWTAIKLLANMGRWDLLLPDSVLKELMLDKLLNRYLMITLCSQTPPSCAGEACKKIADSLPPSWFRGQSVCLPQLQNFRNHIVQKVHSICKEQRPEDPSTRSAVVEQLKLLSKIRCHDSIMTITQKYHYEDAIYTHQLLNQDTL